MVALSENIIDLTGTGTIEGGGGASIVYDANTDILTQPTFGNPVRIISGMETPVQQPVDTQPNLPNYGTAVDNINYIIYVKSNVESANILVDGVNTFKITPNAIDIDVNSVLKSPTGYKTITVSKDGYGTTQKYVFSVIQNPLFNSYIDKTNIDIGIGSSLIGYGNYYDLQRIAQQFQNVYSNEKFYRIKIEYYVDDVIQSFPYVLADQTQNINFELNPITTIIEEPLPINKLPINLDGPDNSVEIVKNNTETISLKNGSNILEFFPQDTITIQSANNLSFRVTNINIASTTTRIAPLEAGVNETLKTSLTLDGDYSIDIKSIEINKGFVETPIINITNPNAREYNINSNAGVPIYIEILRSVTFVTAYVGINKYKFEIAETEKNAVILIPPTAFEKVGNYRVVIVPSNIAGDGDSTDIPVNVIDTFYVGVPDIRNINYPTLIKGADNIGTNVNFDISWDSVNTDYVRIYNGNDGLYTQVNKTGKVNLNFQQLLNLGNQSANSTTSDENESVISLTLKLVPFNSSGVEVVEGKSEFVTIKLQTGKNILPRNLVLNRILEGFTSQFDESVFEQETSKYLTHLLHLGGGDNKVITTWTGSLDSLIVKLYEPVPTSIQPNQQVWISKIQSNPIIETITIVGKESAYCPPLKGPNFNLLPDNGIGFKVFDELIASGSTTSNDLVLRYAASNNIDTTNLNIQYTSGSVYSFENFSHFGSAEERFKNFFYKVQLIENYESKYNELSSGSAWISSINVVNEAKKVQQKISEVKRGFDGLENFLYIDVSSSLAYPKSNGILLSSTNPIVENWYDNAIDSASEYDKYNVNYLVNNLPEHIREDYNNEDFLLFLDMIGQHFDVIWSYINGVNKTKLVENKQFDGVANNMVYHLLQSLGWEGKRAFDSQFLWEYVFGQYKDGTKKYDRPLEDANNEVWRRILNNLPYLLKHKGTGRAMKAIMACYGVPQSMLTIMEFGGPQDPTKGGTTQFTFDDRTAAIQMKSGSLIQIPWKVVPTTAEYPYGVEFRIKPDVVKNTKLITFGDCSLNIVQTTGSLVQLKFSVGSSVTADPYFQATYYNDPTYTVYVLPPDTLTGSLDFPLSTENYSNILINRRENNDGSLYEILFATSNGNRITTYVSMSLLSQGGPWETGSVVTIGNDFSGALDEVRLWKVPLQTSKFENHTLFPDAINGNSYTASTSDLLFRLDFEYPKDRTNDNQIKNVSINTLYAESFATASRFYSASAYPYQYIPYDRTVTANVPSTGLSYSNKIRFESASLVTDLSYKVRATKKSFDQAPIDSNRLGLFFSPIKELNMDILKAFGDFNIDNYIGNPADEYKDSYKELETLRNYYFERLDRNIYEYIQLVKYVDKSLFDVLADLAPARAKISKGLLIEPHFLERSKVRWDKPTSVRGDYDTNINIDENNEIESTYNVEEMNIVANDTTNLVGELPNYDAIIENSDLCVIDGTNPNYDTNIGYDTTNLLQAEAPFYDFQLETPNGQSLTKQSDSVTLTQIANDKNSLANAGFGLYAKDGNGLVRPFDGVFGNFQLTGSRQSIFLVKESYVENVSTQVAGWPVNGAQPGEQVVYQDVPVTKYKYTISKLPFSGSVSLGNNTLEVIALNGYLPTHYRYTNNLSEGMQRTYWKGSQQTAATTPDGLSPVETFTTNPNILRVAKTGRGSGEPILEVD